jgi:plasmid stability protein
MHAEETRMATLTIRNLEDGVVERLKEQAAHNNRSLEAEVREILKNNTHRPSVEQLLALADRIAAMTPNVPQTDSTKLIREDRDR